MVILHAKPCVGLRSQRGDQRALFGDLCCSHWQAVAQLLNFVWSNMSYIKKNIPYLLLFVVPFAVFDNEYLIDKIRHASPFNQLEENVQLIVFCLVMSFFVLAGLGKKINIYVKASAVVPLVLFHFYLSFKALVFSNTYEFVRQLSGAFLIFLVFNMMLEHTRDPLFRLDFLKKIYIVIAFWICAVLYIFFMDGFDALQHSGRFFFFSSHQNHSGGLWACVVVILFALSLERNRSNIFLLYILIAVSSIFLIATGSRGALLSAVVTIGAYFFIKAINQRSTLHIGVIALFFAMLVIMLNTNNFLSKYTEVQIDRGNTREGTYANALNDFFNNFIFGYIQESSRILYSENSILGFAQTGGVVGLVFCFLFYRTNLKLLFDKKLYLDENTRFAILILLVVNLLSMFEAYSLNFIGIVFYLNLFMLAYLKNHDR
jgi:hypothetical protein